MKKATFRQRNAGFSLIELMVALAAGLIVVGAVLKFTLSSLQANTEFVTTTRLTQELRANLNLVADDLRRAGYDEDSLGYLARPATFTGFSRFATIEINDDLDGDGNGCVVYAYDRLPGAAGGPPELANGEIRAFRLKQRTVNGQVVGVLEFAESTAGVTPRCDGGSPDYNAYPAACANGWCAVSDPRVVDIQEFILNKDAVVNLGSVMHLRRIGIDLRGHLVGQPQTSRSVHASVRIRAECVRADPDTNCSAPPSGV